MDYERLQRLRSLFAEAISLPEDERAAFVEQACEDDATLSQELWQLLREDESASHFLQPLTQDLSLPDSPDPQIGQRLGPYEIVSSLGRGGMGAVYRAKRTDFDQDVAIKLIKRGMDSDEILRRFRKEIQFLASLGKHPNIAGLLDAGTSDTGQPYLVMEYVDGQRVDHYCDEHELTIPQRLQLFREICAAVAFAHHHTVIHRDLKPNNILVTKDGEAKLIDFGIAKLLSPASPDATASPAQAEAEQTATAHRFLTPAYASPEQFLGENLTTASDVYSLGVILYLLLTGRRPYDSTLTGEQSREEAPERPSQAITKAIHQTSQTKSETLLEDVSRSRRLAPRRLKRLLIGDLDNIVLMALRREPERRYATAEQLSADIERYLEGLPVQAQPDTWRYRAGKFIGRNRVALVATALVALSLITGIIGTTTQWLRADRYFQQTREEAKKTSSALDEANKNLDKAMKLVENLHSQLGERALDDIPGMGPIRYQLLDYALKFYLELWEQHPENKTIVLETARAYGRFGQCCANLGKDKEAADAYRECRAPFSQLIESEPENTEYPHLLSMSLEGMASLQNDLGREKEAAELFEEAVTVAKAAFDSNNDNERYRKTLCILYNNYGSMLRTSNKEYARKLLLASVELIKPLLEAKHEMETSLSIQAVSHLTLAQILAENPANLDQVVEHFQRVTTSIKDYPNESRQLRHFFAVAHQLWAKELSQRAQYVEAAKHLDLAITQQQYLVKAYGFVHEYREKLAMSLYERARIYRTQGAFQKGFESARQSSLMLQQLATEFPKIPAYQSHASLALRQLATFAMRAGQLPAALQCVEKSTELDRARLRTQANKRAPYSDLVEDYRLQGDILGSMKKLKEAGDAYQAALQVAQQAATKAGVAAHAPMLASLNYSIARNWGARNNVKEAEKYYAMADEIHKRRGPTSYDGLKGSAWVAVARANLWDSAPNMAEQARKEYQRAIQMLQNAIKLSPQDVQLRHILGQTFNNSSLFLKRQGVVTADSEMHAARDIFQSLVNQFPTTAQYRFDLCGAFSNLGEYERALPHAELLVKQMPQSPAYRQRLTMVLDPVARTAFNAQDWEAAAIRFQQLAQLVPTASEYRFFLAMTLAKQGKREAALLLHQQGEQLLQKKPTTEGKTLQEQSQKLLGEVAP